jgi:hypothetical protein
MEKGFSLGDYNWRDSSLYPHPAFIIIIIIRIICDEKKYEWV